MFSNMDYMKIGNVVQLHGHSKKPSSGKHQRTEFGPQLRHGLEGGLDLQEQIRRNGDELDACVLFRDAGKIHAFSELQTCNHEKKMKLRNVALLHLLFV